MENTNFARYVSTLVAITILSCSLASFLALKFTPVPSDLKFLGTLSVNAGIIMLGLFFIYIYKSQRSGLQHLTSKQRREIQSAYARGNLPFHAELVADARHYATGQQQYLKRYIWLALLVNLGLALLFLGFNILANLHVSGHRTYWSFSNTTYQIFYLFLGLRIAYRANQNIALRPDPRSAHKLAIQDQGWFERHWW